MTLKKFLSMYKGKPNDKIVIRFDGAMCMTTVGGFDGMVKAGGQLITRKVVAFEMRDYVLYITVQ